MIGTNSERESWKSLLAVWLDDDDNSLIVNQLSINKSGPTTVELPFHLTFKKHSVEQSDNIALCVSSDPADWLTIDD